MFHATLPSPALRQFQSRVHGRLICKGDGDYDQARRVWNGRIDRYPLVLVYCADVADVVTAVAFAREHHLLVAVRSGGHSLNGCSVCDEGLVIDLSGLKGILLDPEKRTVWAQAGLQHFVEPKDTAKLVEVANGISAGLTRSLNWISLPVPRERSDEAYFAPLLNLHLHPETELYLGLVHFTDGIEGTQKRIEAAQRVVAQFGAATECGCGRRPSETISELLRLHREVAAPR